MVRMSCFFCTHKKGVGDIEDEVRIPSTSRRSDNHPERRNGDKSFVGEVKDRDSASGGKSIGAKSFTFSELAAATENFKEVNSIGEGGFGRVYMGRLESGQAVAIKRLNLDGLQGFQEFIVEVLMLSLLHHPNLVTLIGYCSDGDQRLLVYEFMPMGSLEDHLFYAADMGREPLDWSTRLKIAVGAARGLEYLHCKANPPVIYRDLKSANILLDSGFNPKLSDFGLAKLGPVGDNTHVSTRVMGTYGYCAPEYAMSGRLTPKSDIYSFGVVLLELITGRKAIDISKKQGQQNLVAWSRPYMKDERKFLQIADPSLQGCFPARNLRHAVAITAMCLQEQPSSRPTISDIVPALEFLASQTSTLKPCKTDGNSPSLPTLSPSPSPSPSLPSLSLPSSSPSPSPSPSPTTSPPSPPRLWDDFLYPSARD